MDKSELPFQTKPRNPLSSGLASLRDEARGSHPIEELEKSYESEGWVRDDLLQNVYGTGFIARKKIERQLLNRMGPQPGMHSSKLGLESLTGKLDSFSFQSYVGSSAREEEMSGKDIIR